MKIAVVQMRPEFGDVEGNASRVVSMIESKRADLYVLPELALSGYLFESKEEASSLAQKPADEVFDEIGEAGRSAGGTVVLGFAEKAEGGLYNSAILLAPDGTRFVYRKIQLFSGEKDVFEPGDESPRVIEVGGVRFGMMICFDWIFPEVARTLALGGAQILCHPANLVLPYCQDAMVTRCIENRVFAATSNRVGSESRAGQELTFTGMSEIVAPDGEIIVRADAESEEVLVADVDPGRADDKLVTPRNDLFSDRRPEIYRL